MKTIICWIAGLVAAVHGFTAPFYRRGGLQTRRLEIFLVPDPQGCRGLPEGFPEAKVTVVVKEEKQPPKVFDLKTAKATLEAKHRAKSQATTTTTDAEIALEQFEAAIEAVREIEREQVEDVAKSAIEQPIDVSIPYDAPARLAFEASDKSMSYADFKVKYEAEAVADVISKTLAVEKEPELATVDISIPYDAPARLAYEASDKSVAYADFKVKYEADAVADVVSKRSIDISIPYDLDKAKATLTNQSAESQATTATADAEVALAQFEAAFEAVLEIEREQVEEAAKSGTEKASTAKKAEAIAKQPIDASIPYDAPARLAYEASDKSMAYADFKQKYQDDALADVTPPKNRVTKEAEDKAVVKEQEQPSAPTDVSKTKALDERGKLATEGIQSYTDFLEPGKFAKVERKDGEPISPQLRVLSAGYMDQLQKAAQNNPLVLKDELEKRRVVEDDEADPAR